MIQASMRIIAPSEKRGEILDVMQGMLGPTEVSRGCLSCQILFDFDNGDAITYIMRWDTKSDLQEHLRSERFRRLLPYMELSIRRPEVEVSIIEPIGGMELLVSSIQQETNG
jgi:quinol monooxygenase YgiN